MKNPSDPYNLGALANDPFDAQSGGVALSVVAVERISQDIVVVERVRQALTNAEPAGESAPGQPTPAVLTGGTQAPGSPGAGGPDEGLRGRVASLRQRVTRDRQRGRRGDPTDRLLVGQFRSGGDSWRCPGGSWRTAGGGSG